MPNDRHQTEDHDARKSPESCFRNPLAISTHPITGIDPFPAGNRQNCSQMKERLPTMFSSARSPHRLSRLLSRLSPIMKYGPAGPTIRPAHCRCNFPGEARGIGDESRGIGVVERRCSTSPSVSVKARGSTAVRVQIIRHLLDGHRLAVDGQPLVLVGHLVAGQSHHPLDVVEGRIFRVAEDHHVARCGVDSSMIFLLMTGRRMPGEFC